MALVRFALTYVHSLDGRREEIHCTPPRDEHVEDHLAPPLEGLDAVGTALACGPLVEFLPLPPLLRSQCGVSAKKHVRPSRSCSEDATSGADCAVVLDPSGSLVPDHAGDSLDSEAEEELEQLLLVLVCLLLLVYLVLVLLCLLLEQVVILEQVLLLFLL